ncbi:MAG: HAD family phosphatase [Candidatus Micrarchaeota archaeon]|nr:HAD family phosphatase [Candidatus Micrarchaeota archaeon]
MIKCILFDLGGVLVDFSDDDYFRYLSKVSGKKPKEVEKLLDYWWRRIDLGLIHIKFFEEKIEKLLKIPKEKVQWIEFYEKRVKLNNKMMKLKKALRKRYKVAFLSNIDFSRYDIAMSRLDMKHFDRDFASCYMKLRKPDPEIYKVVAKKMKLKPQEIVFIDNRLDNVLGARSAGMKALWFKGNRAVLEKQLKKLNVKWGK